MTERHLSTCPICATAPPTPLLSTPLLSTPLSTDLGRLRPLQGPKSSKIASPAQPAHLAHLVHPARLAYPGVRA
ncbi:hypothetical protein ACTMS0_07560 [Micromonospora sp. H33]|uniref:hypothetical protein n=1 Tax=Micromonospora sp. H33 TaxID=3452215 RepID=UPI003F89EC99